VRKRQFSGIEKNRPDPVVLEERIGSPLNLAKDSKPLLYRKGLTLIVPKKSPVSKYRVGSLSVVFWGPIENGFKFTKI
jgi:hypothetical protein